jgi:hypothetical protein
LGCFKRGDDNVQVEGLVVMLEANKAGDGTSTMKWDNVDRYLTKS